MGRGVRQIKEDFECENCGLEVTGNGFTNHCPQCLCSKHVDNTPGDRAMLEECGCLMEPVEVKTKGGSFVLVHRCINCGIKSVNRTSPEDDMNEIQRIVHKTSRQRGAKRL